MGCRLLFTRMRSEPVVEAVCTSSVGIYVVTAVSMPRKRNSMSDVEPSSSEGEQTDGERGEGLAQVPDAPETAAQRMAESPAWPVTTEVRFDATGGAYVCRRAPLRTGGVTAIPKIPQRGRGPSRLPQQDKKEFRHQRCQLCNHECVFETRSGLNSHSVLQHGKYYSLNKDDFVPIPECDLVAAQEKAKRGRQHRQGQSINAPVGVVTPWCIAPAPSPPTCTRPSDFV